MIRFIASDIDGTLLRNGNTAISAETLDLLGRLCDRGIIVAIASGRQYPTMKRLFGDIADKLIYICENGALVVYKGKILSKTVMDREIVLEIVEDILSMPNCEVLLSGKYVSYLKPKTQAYFDRIHDRIKNNICLPVDFSKIDDEFLKVACCDTSGIVNSKDHFYEKWSGKVKTAVSGELYFDFTSEGVNKGDALTKILKEYNISSEEAMAFGDSYNDIEMLNNVKFSYAMSDADDEIKAHAYGTTSDVNIILRKVLLGEI